MSDEYVHAEIQKIVGRFEQLPYLFIGTGFSKRYGSNAPSWEELLQQIWMSIHCNSSLQYQKFVTVCRNKLERNRQDISEENRMYYLNPEIASEIQSEFSLKVFQDEEFGKVFFSKMEQEDIFKNEIDPLKHYIGRIIQKISLNNEAYEYDELNALIANQNKIAGVITTNYDTLLETIFRDFGVVVGQDELLLARTDNIFEIYKIHGSCTKPQSIVITAEDYNRFSQKLSYLSAKLLTIFIEHPVIFIGYSIGDWNIRNILSEMAGCLNTEMRKKLEKNLLFVNPILDKASPDAIRSKELDFSFAGHGRIAMTELNLKDYTPLYESLSCIKSSMPVKFLRKLQDMVCQYVFSTDAPKNNIIVSSLSNSNIEDSQLGLYIGNVADISRMGFDTYDIWDIIGDILFDDKPFLMNREIIKTFNNIRSRGGATFLPIYKYKRGLALSESDVNPNWHIIKSLETFELNKNERQYAGLAPNQKRKATVGSIEEVMSKYPDHHLRQYANIMASIEAIDCIDLQRFLQERVSDVSLRDKESTHLKKLVALYDFKKYGENKEDAIHKVHTH